MATFILAQLSQPVRPDSPKESTFAAESPVTIRHRRVQIGALELVRGEDDAWQTGEHAYRKLVLRAHKGRVEIAFAFPPQSQERSLPVPSAWALLWRNELFLAEGPRLAIDDDDTAPFSFRDVRDGRSYRLMTIS